MTKILIVINNYHEVSHNRHLLRLLNYLSNQKVDLNLLSLGNSGQLKSEFRSTNRLKTLRIKDCIHFFHLNQKIVVLTKELRSEYFVFFLKLIFGWKKYRHISIRPSFGFLPESPWKICKNILFAISLRLVDKNIAVGKTVQKRILESTGTRNQKVLCIPNSIEEDFVKKYYRPKNQWDNIRFTYSGFLDSRKNLHYALKILESLGVTFTFDILGDGPEKNQLLSQIHQNGLSGKVYLRGHVENVGEYLQQGNAFLFLSKMEGLSLSLLEAMGAGLVCVVSDIPENRELVNDMSNGVLLPLNNIKQAKTKLRMILSKPEMLTKISQAAKKTIVDKYVDSKSFAAYQQILCDQ